MIITTAHYLVLAAVLFSLAVAGIFLNRKNVILLLMCIELMLLAVNFNFIAFSRYGVGGYDGQVFSIFVIMLAAAEAAIALAIVLGIYQMFETIDVGAAIGAAACSLITGSPASGSFLPLRTGRQAKVPRCRTCVTSWP